MADDGRSILDRVRENWIEPFTAGAIASENRSALLSQSGLSSYLAAARKVSDYVCEQLKKQPNLNVKAIPGAVQFGHTAPLFLPVSAIDGARLQRILNSPKEEQEAMARQSGDPVPAHVELPLLIALCAQTNALM
jgi:hypothetical protein